MQELVELADTVGRSEEEVLIRKSFAKAIREYKQVLPKWLENIKKFCQSN